MPRLVPAILSNPQWREKELPEEKAKSKETKTLRVELAALLEVPTPMYLYIACMHLPTFELYATTGISLIAQKVADEAVLPAGRLNCLAKSLSGRVAHRSS